MSKIRGKGAGLVIIDEVSELGAAYRWFRRKMARASDGLACLRSTPPPESLRPAVSLAVRLSRRQRWSPDGIGHWREAAAIVKARGRVTERTAAVLRVELDPYSSAAEDELYRALRDDIGVPFSCSVQIEPKGFRS